MDEYNTVTIDEPDKKFKLIPLLIFLGLQVLEAIGTIIVAALIGQSHEYFFSLTWFGGKLLTLVVAIAVYHKSFARDAKSSVKNFGKFIAFSLVSFIIFYVFSSGLTYYETLIDKWFDLGEAANQEGIYEYIKSSNDTIHYILLGLTIAILAPILEEFEFRKLIFDSFPGCHFLVPAIVSSLIFGLAHMAEFAWTELLFLPVYVLPGFFFALVYHYSGNNMYVSFFVHMTSNLISFLLIMTNLDSI